MIIALDYDGTYTKDPDFWLAFLQSSRNAGHEVFCCTMRTPEESREIDPRLSFLVQIIATSREAKLPFMQSLGVKVDIWIDDNPMFIVSDAGDRPPTRQQSSTVALQSVPKAKARMVIGKPSQGAKNVISD